MSNGTTACGVWANRCTTPPPAGCACRCCPTRAGYGYLALPAVEKDDADVYRALLRAQYIRCRKLGWHYMVGSMHENDPLLPVMNEYPYLAAGGRLFVVAFDTPPEPDGRVQISEAAAP